MTIPTPPPTKPELLPETVRRADEYVARRAMPEPDASAPEPELRGPIHEERCQRRTHPGLPCTCVIFRTLGR